MSKLPKNYNWAKNKAYSKYAIKEQLGYLIDFFSEKDKENGEVVLSGRLLSWLKAMDREVDCVPEHEFCDAFQYLREVSARLTSYIETKAQDTENTDELEKLLDNKFAYIFNRELFSIFFNSAAVIAVLFLMASILKTAFLMIFVLNSVASLTALSCLFSLAVASGTSLQSEVVAVLSSALLSINTALSLILILNPGASMVAFASLLTMALAFSFFKNHPDHRLDFPQLLRNFLMSLSIALYFAPAEFFLALGIYASASTVLLVCFIGSVFLFMDNLSEAYQLYAAKSEIQTMMGFKDRFFSSSTSEPEDLTNSNLESIEEDEEDVDHGMSMNF